MAGATKDEILALETEYWNALCRKDGETASRLSTDSSIVAGRQGVTEMSRQTMKSLTADGNWTLDSYEFEDVAFVAPAPNVAVLAYTVTQTVTMEGKQETRRAADSSTWVKGPDGWQCCAHNECYLD